MENEMRLIDYEQAKRATYEEIFWTESEQAVVRHFLAKLPKMDAVEVAHGHWEDGCAIHNGKEAYKSIDCSVCNDIFKIESHDQEYWKKRFKVCPFCGAHMNGGNKDG